MCTPSFWDATRTHMHTHIHTYTPTHTQAEEQIASAEARILTEILYAQTCTHNTHTHAQAEEQIASAEARILAEMRAEKETQAALRFEKLRAKRNQAKEDMQVCVYLCVHVCPCELVCVARHTYRTPNSFTFLKSSERNEIKGKNTCMYVSMCACVSVWACFCDCLCGKLKHKTYIRIEPRTALRFLKAESETKSSKRIHVCMYLCMYLCLVCQLIHV
jgi:hypothetical protein